MDTLEKMQAWFELSEAKARYCRFLDTKSWENFADLLTEDFELDLSGASHHGTIKGRDEALNLIRGSLTGAVTAHQVHNPEIALNGNEAIVIWAMQDRVVWAADKPSLVGYGHYNERWIKRSGEWKLAAQRLTRLHVDMLPPTAKPQA
jgi:hypothetical protein